MSTGAATVDARAFRDALGLFPTGVAIITAVSPGGERLGATVSSFNSVSLDPPLVLFSIAKSAKAFDEWSKVDAYAVNVLSQDQSDMSSRFARPMSNKWEGVMPRQGAYAGLPLLNNSLAWFECKPYAQYEGGDHVIFVGEVMAMQARVGTPPKPLVFYRGQYRRLEEAAMGDLPYSDGMLLHGW
ncbi:flavin reductase family protein [Ramlibacter sp.]|uniref:flavin reductase family protein n=1 Tax=Ramlibacter sp. TaxID=1917967 RepID=UPI003D109B07